MAGFKAMGAGGSLVLLYGGEPASRLLAVMQAGALGQIRTGAATGVATRYMAREDSTTVEYHWHREPGHHPAGGRLCRPPHQLSQGI